MQALSESTRAALQRLVVRSDAEIEALERDERKAEAGLVLGRIPAFVREVEPKALLARLGNGELRRAACSWYPEHGNLLLLGMTDRGKSTTAAYCFRKVLGRGVQLGGKAWRMARCMHWFNAKDLERARLEHPLGKDEAPEILDAIHASVLVLDDAGWDRDPTAVSAVLAERYERALPTIVTSALGKVELAKHYGGAVARRMSEAGGPNVTIVEVK